MELDVERDILLAKSLEQADVQATLIPLSQRDQLTREAKALARTRASDNAPDTHFLALRADLLLRAVATTHPLVQRYRQPHRALSYLLYALPLFAFLSGLLTERISNPYRIDLLAFPLLAIIAWNLLVYLGLLVSCLTRFGSNRSGLLRLFNRLQWPVKSTTRLPAALLRGLHDFSREWTATHSQRWAKRWSSALHWSAAALALGMVFSLYGRGLIVAYQVGWESTFLSVNQVTTILNTLFWPVSFLIGLPAFSVAEIAGLEFGGSSGVQQGAAWVHRYAALLTLIVVIPRLCLGVLDAWRSQHQNRPTDYLSPYFQRLLGELSEQVLDVRLLPYSLELHTAQLPAIQEALRAQLSTTARLSLLPATAYGESPPFDRLTQAEQALLVVVFSASSTPEPETQGAFLTALLEQFPGRVLVLLDQHRLEQKWGGFPDSAQRLEQRQALWQQFLAHYGVHGYFASLSSAETLA